MVDDVNDGWLSAGRPQQQGSIGRPRPGAKKAAAAGKHDVKRHRRTTASGKKVPVTRHDRTDPGGSGHGRGGGGGRRTAGTGGPGRRPNGKPTRKTYQQRARAAISPRSARRNLRTAWTKNRKGRNGQAIGLALAGISQLVLWLAIQGTFLLIAGAALLFAAIALVIDEVVDGEGGGR